MALPAAVEILDLCSPGRTLKPPKTASDLRYVLSKRNHCNYLGVKQKRMKGAADPTVNLNFHSVAVREKDPSLLDFPRFPAEIKFKCHV